VAAYCACGAAGDFGCLVISGSLVTLQLTVDYVLSKLMCCHSGSRVDGSTPELAKYARAINCLSMPNFRVSEKHISINVCAFRIIKRV
jgi:hypothetical protein